MPTGFLTPPVNVASLNRTAVNVSDCGCGAGDCKTECGGGDGSDPP